MNDEKVYSLKAVFASDKMCNNNDFLYKQYKLPYRNKEAKIHFYI
ncbi:hypothetical protein THOB06_170019 [Vibrio rotiferianus]|nr:hypothetical protein THOG10_170020 [Vibrio rotiferianus]CAH1568535.1 hypothetical protein THOB06_170019 [Vibrio rotiferianus]